VAVVTSKKRLWYWLIAAAAPFVICALLVTFIAIVGRQGTLVGRYDRVESGMQLADAFATLGSGFEYWNDKELHWSEGPANVTLHVQLQITPPSGAEGSEPRIEWLVAGKDLHIDGDGNLWWRIHRLAEQAWARMHGPSRE
jgi:hypothetical protein